MDDEIIINVKNVNDSNKKTKRKKNIKNSKKKMAAKNKAAQKEKTSSLKKGQKAKNNIRSLEKARLEKKQKKISKVFLVLAVIGIIILIMMSSLFNVNTINVVGNAKVSSEKIISLSKIEKHSNIFRFNKRQAIDNIKENAYIETVSITRKIPNTVEIEVTERTENFMLQFADSYVYINNQGYMLDISNEKLNLPIIIGITTDLSNIQAGNRMNREDLEKLQTVIEIYETAKRNGLNELITKIDVSDTKNYTLILETEGKTVYLGDVSDELNTKFLYLKDILEYEKGNSGEIFLNENLNNQRGVRFREKT